jgi:hypothetical protein
MAIYCHIRGLEAAGTPYGSYGDEGCGGYEDDFTANYICKRTSYNIKKFVCFLSDKCIMYLNK